MRVWNIFDKALSQKIEKPNNLNVFVNFLCETFTLATI